MMERRLLKPDEVATKLGMSLAWVNKGRIKGFGPPFVRIGRRVFYESSDLERWISSRPRLSSTSEVAA